MIADLLQLFTQLLKEAPAEGSDDLRLVLSACKFLDTALTVQTNEFQIHQWMFITDTVDAVYPPEEWRPAALLDRLSEVVSDLPLQTTKQHAEDPRHVLGERSVPKLRKPLLTELDHISGIVQLGFFFLACKPGLL